MNYLHHGWLVAPTIRVMAQWLTRLLQRHCKGRTNLEQSCRIAHRMGWLMAETLSLNDCFLSPISIICIFFLLWIVLKRRCLSSRTLDNDGRLTTCDSKGYPCPNHGMTSAYLALPEALPLTMTSDGSGSMDGFRSRWFRVSTLNKYMWTWSEKYIPQICPAKQFGPVRLS